MNDREYKAVKEIIDADEATIAQLKAQLETAQRKKAQTEELLKAARAGQPLGPLIGAQALVEQEIELNRLRAENAQLAAMVEENHRVLKLLHDDLLSLVPEYEPEAVLRLLELTPPAALSELLKPTMELLNRIADNEVFSSKFRSEVKAEQTRLEKLCGGGQ